MKYRFAIVRDWEDSVSAEEECLRRFEKAAELIGLKCDIVDTQYRVIADRTIKVTKETHDFVLHVHFFSGKAENVFSIAPLWNPIKIYHDWGYVKYVTTLMSNDDFIHSGSTVLTDQIDVLRRKNTFHLHPEFIVYPAPAEVASIPEIRTDRKLFYCGINWEKLTSRKGRFDELLKKLDRTGCLEIYGPKKLRGIKPWEGYKSYKGEIPFDGCSLQKKISECGIALVLSSDIHLKDRIITNRLYEALAAGAVVISDENPAIHEIMGDTCLYVDTKKPNSHEKILNIYEWINSNPIEAKILAEQSQQIFQRRLSAKISLENLYAQIDQRKEKLSKYRRYQGNKKLLVLYILSDENLGANLNAEIIQRSINANISLKITHVVLTNKENKSFCFDNAQLFVSESERGYGELIEWGLQKQAVENYDFISFVLPGEELYDEHFESIQNAIEKEQVEIGCSNINIIHQRIADVQCLGVRTLDYIKKFVCCGAFVFTNKIVNDLGRRKILKFINTGISIVYMVDSINIGESGGSTCKIHWARQIEQQDLDVVRDLRVYDAMRILESKTPVAEVIKEIENNHSKFRKIYYRFYREISFMRRYPKLWNTMKSVAKLFI